MKKTVTTFLLCFAVVSVIGQEMNSIALNLYGGYAFKDKLKFDNFYGYVNDAFEYGAGLEYFMDRTKSIELRYLRMDTDLPLYGPAGTKLNEGKESGAVNYILIGANSYFGSDPHAKTVPYAGLGVGVGIVSIKDANSSTKFAWDMRLGVRIKTSSTMSFKLHGYMQSVIAAMGDDFYLTGAGAPIAVPEFASIFQFGLGGALCFNFKKK